jgi:hypothetical protein
MNNKDIHKKLKNPATRIEPNLSSFMIERFGAPTPKKTFSIWRFFPTATLVLGFFIVGILIGISTPIAITSSTPSITDSNSTTTTSVTSENPSIVTSSEVTLPPLRLEGDKAALSVSTITTASLFSNLTSVNTTPLAGIRLTKPTRPSYDFDETMTLIRPYLGLFEQLLGRADAPMVTTEALIDQPFAYVDRFSVFDIQGNPIDYALYYNLDNVETVNEETFYTLQGELMINQGEPLLVSGSKIIEDDEIILSFKAEADASNYIESIYKYEEDETKIRIRKMVDNVLNVSIFKLEIDQDETEIELLFLEENDENRVQDRFQFEYETEDGENILKISFTLATENGQVKGKIKVLVVEILDENLQVIGYEYLAYELDENDQETDEWRDKRDEHHHDDDDDDDDDDNDDNDDES